MFLPLIPLIELVGFECVHAGMSVALYRPGASPGGVASISSLLRFNEADGAMRRESAALD